MFAWITRIIRTMGAPGIALLMFLENAVPPIPSELIMPLAGFVSARGGLNFWAAVAAGSVGSLAGATAWYYVGRRVGEERLRAWIDRHGRWLTLSCEDMDRAAAWFDRHGHAAVFVGRLIPAVRTVASLPAGFARMPLAPFLAYSAAGTVLWTAALAYAGRLLGANYQRVSAVLEPVSWAVLGAVALAYVVRVVRHPGARARRAGGGRRGRGVPGT